MDSTFAPPSTADRPPGPDTFGPEAPSTAAAGHVSLVPPQLLERIKIGPAPSWVAERPVEIIEATKGGINPGYLLDWQYHAERHEGYTRSVRRLGTMNAVHEASQWRVNIDPLTSRLTIHALIVRRGAQANDNARPERLRVLQREQGLEYQILSGRLTVVVLLEDVRVGDILDIRYTIEARDQLFPDHFSESLTIPYWTLRELYWSVRFATGRPMRWKSYDPKMTPAIREEGAETEWTWHLSKLPGSEPEPNVPGWYFDDPWIQVTDFASWEAVAAGLATAWQEDLQHPEVIRLVESITAETADPTARAERALTYLQDEVRYLSVDSELGGRVPTSPGVVIKRGFGDCKDKSFAAAHLLRLLGIPACPVLVNTVLHQSVQEFLPMPGIFNHAIVEYEVEGVRRWVDVTASLQGGSLLSRTTARFKLGLPIGPGVTELEEISSSDDKAADYRELRETFLIDTSGRPSTLRVCVTARGREADLWRHSLTFEGETKFARDRERFYQQLFSGLHRVGTLEWHDDRERNELEIAEVFDLRDIVLPTPNGRAFTFRLWAHSIQSVLGFAEAEKRQHPWALRYPCHLRHIIEIDSSGLPANIARTSLVEAKAFRFACQVQQRTGFAAVSYDVQTFADHVPAGEFDAHKAKVREVWPRTIVAGQLPAGSIVPWKARTPHNLLARRNSSVSPPKAASPPPLPSSLPPPLPGSIPPANGKTPAPPVAAIPSPIAPPLAPIPRTKPTVEPRPEKAARPKPGTAPERGPVQRPNPLPMSPAEPAKSSSSARSRRSRGRGASVQSGRASSCS